MPRRSRPRRRAASWRHSSTMIGAVVVAVVLTGCTGEDDPAAAPAPSPAASPSPAAPLLEADRIDGGMTEVVVAPAFLDALAATGLTPGVVGQGGYLATERVFSFPVTGGDLEVAAPGEPGPVLAGEVRHDGSGLSLTSGSSTVAFTDLVLGGGDPAEPALSAESTPSTRSRISATVTVDGAVVADRAPVLEVDAATMEPLAVDEAEGTALLRGLRVALTTEGAELLNAAYPGGELPPGATVGTATLTLALPDA